MRDSFRHRPRGGLVLATGEAAQHVAEEAHDLRPRRLQRGIGRQGHLAPRALVAHAVHRAMIRHGRALCQYIGTKWSSAVDLAMLRVAHVARARANGDLLADGGGNSCPQLKG